MPVNTQEKSFVQITDPNSDEFAKFFDIYVESMPASERKTRDAIAAIVQRDDYYVAGLKLGGTVVAFFILFLSATESVGLLEYMATTESVRNQGLGSDLFMRAAELAGWRPLLVEVDSEREVSPDRHFRVRRKNFYMRHGCRQLQNLDYRMPLVGHATPPIMDLLLYWRGHEAAPSPDLVRRWLECIYAEVYGCARDDRRIDDMVRGLLGNTEAQA